jgi:hypothetical protein
MALAAPAAELPQMSANSAGCIDFEDALHRSGQMQQQPAATPPHLGNRPPIQRRFGRRG